MPTAMPAMHVPTLGEQAADNGPQKYGNTTVLGRKSPHFCVAVLAQQPFKTVAFLMNSRCVHPTISTRTKSLSFRALQLCVRNSDCGNESTSQ